MNIDTALSQKSKKVLPKMVNIKINYWWLILFSLLLRILPYIFTATSSHVDIKRICLFLSYVILLFTLVKNLHIKGIWIIAVGTLLNFIAILANGGFMPVSPDARLLAGKTPVILHAGSISLTNAGGVILFPEQTRLRILTDILPVSSLHAVFSAGDVIIAIGILVVCIRIIFQVVKRAPASALD